MKSSKKILLSTVGIAIMIVTLVGVTFAFFNYTRTGNSNVIKVGRISFNSEQGNAINLSNVFPIDKSKLDEQSDHVGSVTIHVTGDTTYSEGIEYLVTATSVTNTVGSEYNSKKIPISIDTSYSTTNNKEIGENDKDYFDNRGGNTSIYKVLASKTVNEGNKLIVGYIAPNETGIDGTITIKAYVDKDKIAISDTYLEDSVHSINPNLTEQQISDCIHVLEDAYYDYYLEDGESLNNFCNGTGTLYGQNFQYWFDNNWFGESLVESLSYYNVIYKSTNGTLSSWVNERTVFTTDEWNSLQTNGVSFQIKVEANEGIWVAPVDNAMLGIPPIFKENNINQSIKEIYFNKMTENEMHQRYDAATIKANITYDDEGEVLAWLEENSNDNTKYNMYIVSTGTTFLMNASTLFQNANLTYADKIEFNNLNTSRVTSMDNMFRNMTLYNLDISYFDTSNVISINDMFNNATIGTVNMSNMDLPSLTDSTSTFAASKITNLYLNGINAPNLTRTHTMFSGSTIANIHMSDMVLTNLQNMVYMFSEATITTINFGDEFDVSNVIDMTGTFISTKISTLDLSSWKTNSLINLHSTFSNCTATTLLFGEGFNTSNVTDMDYTFQGSRVNSLDLSNFDTSNVNTMYGMFDASRTTTVYVSDLWNTGKLSHVDDMFLKSAIVGAQGTRPYESCDISAESIACTNNINSTKSDYARIDNPPDSPGYFTYKAHS